MRLKTQPFQIIKGIIASAFIVSAVMPATSAFAQQPAQEAPPYYQVELIVFETTALKGWTEEFWPHQVPDIETEGSFPIQPNIMFMAPANQEEQTPAEVSEKTPEENSNVTVLPATITLDDPTEETPLPLENRNHAFLLSASQPDLWLLNEEAEKLTPSKGYRILLHASWVQQALPEKSAQPLYFETEAKNEYSPVLTGTVTLHKQRYAHINTTFNLERFIPHKIRDKFARHEDLEPELLPDFWHFHLDQSRKIKPGQLHYIDHPLFGILAQIKRVKPEKLASYQAIAVKDTRTLDNHSSEE
jgi:hypothetical protein